MFRVLDTLRGIISTPPRSQFLFFPPLPVVSASQVVSLWSGSRLSWGQVPHPGKDKPSWWWPFIFNKHVHGGGGTRWLEDKAWVSGGTDLILSQSQDLLYLACPVGPGPPGLRASEPRCRVSARGGWGNKVQSSPELAEAWVPIPQGLEMWVVPFSLWPAGRCLPFLRTQLTEGPTRASCVQHGGSFLHLVFAADPSCVLPSLHDRSRVDLGKTWVQ